MGRTTRGPGRRRSTGSATPGASQGSRRRGEAAGETRKGKIDWFMSCQIGDVSRQESIYGIILRKLKNTEYH